MAILRPLNLYGPVGYFKTKKSNQEDKYAYLHRDSNCAKIFRRWQDIVFLILIGVSSFQTM